MLSITLYCVVLCELLLFVEIEWNTLHSDENEINTQYLENKSMFNVCVFFRVSVVEWKWKWSEKWVQPSQSNNTLQKHHPTLYYFNFNSFQMIMKIKLEWFHWRWSTIVAVNHSSNKLTPSLKFNYPWDSINSISISTWDFIFYWTIVIVACNWRLCSKYLKVRSLNS